MSATIPATITALFTSLSSVGIVFLLNSETVSFPGWATALILLISVPLLAYGSSIGMSVLVRHNAKCKSYNIESISLSNLVIALSTFLTGAMLSFENVPILKSIFGEYDPRDPFTGQLIPKDTPAFQEAMLNENHYKIQFLSNIVKDALPVYFSNEVKLGFVYFYYMFFLTLLPAFFVMTSQATCA